MPTNRTRKTRGRIGADGLSNDAFVFFKWHGTISNGFSDGKTPDEILAFWREHRVEILARYLAENRLRGRAGMRPSFYFEELERKQPRRKTGKEKWIGPVRIGGGDRTIIDDVFETDFQYLKRLDLLEKWELAGEILKGTKKSKKREE